jgi:hypothetical protein
LIADFTLMEAAKIAAGISNMPLIWQLCCLAAGTLLSCMIGAATLAPDFIPWGQPRTVASDGRSLKKSCLKWRSSHSG